jgi:hypothetical protein
MKTIVNKLRYALLLGFIAIGMTALAQTIANIEKMSISTQLFLNELEYGVSLDEAPAVRGNGPVLTPKDKNRKHQRPIAKPDTINGKVFISAFISINHDSEISKLESLGVRIESKFENGLLTALIPVDKIHEVAALDGVTRISVATLMQQSTDRGRQTTNVDDVLAYTTDAINAGLPHGYDGTGVILGIIDAGIDFQHPAFKDKDGNSRIKGVYCYNGSTTTDWSGSGTLPTTDDNTGDHGTHTSSIAGGSSVIVNGTNVTVTDDHAHATYGGMAPGADLYLAGTNDLADTRIATAMQRMYNYATAQGKPLVVSNSWGTHNGPHDGTGYISSVIHQYFGDSHPNNICLLASGNEAGDADPDEGGGFHVSGNASSGSPLGTIIRQSTYSNVDNGMVYRGILANAWCRSTSVASMGCRVLVINVNTGAVVTSVNVNPTTSGAAVSGLSNYYSGTLYAYKDYFASDNKTEIILYANGTSGYMQSQSYTSGDIYKSNYTLAVEFYPTNGSAVIDVWAPRNNYIYYSNLNNLTTNGHTWTNGSDDMTASDESTIPDAISVGAYTSKNTFVNSDGDTMSAGSYTVDDITYFSSYATPQESPTGLQYPWITAPGALITSAVNHHHTTSVDDYSYYGTNYKNMLVVNSSTAPYAIMQGTSMACPAAAGIVALWMQAAQECEKNLNTTEIKNIMAESAIKDSWVTSGPNASHFGNGKINALGGIEYILNHYGITDPTIRVSSNQVSFVGEPGNSYNQTITVTGYNLTGDITATLTDSSGAFSINTTNLGNGNDLVITFTPNEEGQFTATITLTSPGAEPMTITITGVAAIHIGTLTSNTVEVPVYKSDIKSNGNTYIFNQSQVNDDINMTLSYGQATGDVEVLVKSDEAIKRYELHHKIGDQGNWTYPNGSAVATATHVENSYDTYVIGNDSFTFPQDATEMWLPMTDGQLPNNTTEVTYYVPVTVAKGVVVTTRENTYGAPITDREVNGIQLEVNVSGSKSDGSQWGHWAETQENNTEYCVYTPIITINYPGFALQNRRHVPYRFRAWLLDNEDVSYYDFFRNPDNNNYLECTNKLTMPYLLADSIIEDNVDASVVRLGEEWDDQPFKLQNAFAAPCEDAGVMIAVRVYYQKVIDESNGAKLRAGGDDGLYGFAESSTNGEGIVTGIIELITERQVVGVTYVNALGQQSDKPFDGVNIVVTRYSDGSITTSKVLK